MNRRQFLQSAFGVGLGALTVGAKLRAGNLFDQRPISSEELRDLLIWAPYEAFLPGEPNPTLSDPSEGTETGVLKTADIIAGKPLTMKYWHGHGGRDHTFTITSDHLVSLRAGEAVVIQIATTTVGDHFHFAVIDPNRPA